ncbi:MAG TPA: cell division protein FtsQ/DivIB [Xanthobacteraceae bacterium]|nr:cell division protein FtsQ/DivIB [Xanthobacteraceae bacterium]
MDGRGRLAKPLSNSFARARRRTADFLIGWQRLLRRWLKPVIELDPPRGVGIAASALLLIASAGYGVVCADLGPTIAGELRDVRDAAANSLGFRIKSVALEGQRHVTIDEVLGALGITPRSSLLFLDAADARERLMSNPWISEAKVLKLYPNQLHIEIVERKAFALWQKDRKISVIAADGKVLEEYTDGQFAALPLVVGAGADTGARDFLALIGKYPALRPQIYASSLVAERRWNLKLKNGIEIKLPEFDAGRALDTLMELDRVKKLLSRDIETIDLRLPDRVVVRLSDEAAEAKEDAAREREKELDKKLKRKGGAA